MSRPACGRLIAAGVAIVTCMAACASGANEPIAAGLTPPVSGFGVWSSDTPMRWTLRGDIHALRTEDRHEDAERRYATLEAFGDTTRVPVWLRTRGVFRLDPRNCSFPPLRIQVVNDSLSGPRPDWLRRLGNAKMTVPCTRSDSDLVPLEYLAYRIRNLLGDESFRVRPVVATFIDESGRDEPLEAWTFIAEGNGRLARRLDWTEIPDSVIPVVDPRILSPDLAALNEAFQYLIGNTDWSIRARHNQFVALDSIGVAVAAPYDFDFAGLVDAKYAVPDPQLRDVTTVTQRVFRGVCRPDDVYARALNTILSQEEEILALVDQVPLSGRARAKTRSYLAEFFDDARDGDRLVRTFRYSCVDPA